MYLIIGAAIALISFICGFFTHAAMVYDRVVVFYKKLGDEVTE